MDELDRLEKAYRALAQSLTRLEAMIRESSDRSESAQRGLSTGLTNLSGKISEVEARVGPMRELFNGQGGKATLAERVIALELVVNRNLADVVDMKQQFNRSIDSLGEKVDNIGDNVHGIQLSISNVTNGIVTFSKWMEEKKDEKKGTNRALLSAGLSGTIGFALWIAKLIYELLTHHVG